MFDTNNVNDDDDDEDDDDDNNNNNNNNTTTNNNNTESNKALQFNSQTDGMNCCITAFVWKKKYDVCINDTKYHRGKKMKRSKEH